MNTQKMILAVGILIFSALTSNTASAYFTTAQSTTRLNSDTVLYTVTYKFGFQKRELYMPIVTKRGLEAVSDEFKVGYDIMHDDKQMSTGTTNAVVLSGDSDVEIKDGQYFLPKGKTAEFTLVALLTTESLDTLHPSLLVTSLPFTMIQDDTKIEAHLNPSELQYYRTPAVVRILETERLK